MGAIGAIAGAIVGAGSLAAIGLNMGNGKGDSSSAIGGDMSDPSQSSKDIMGEKAQLASSENRTVQQEDVQSQLQANNAKPGLYIDNPKKSLAELASRANMQNNNQN